MAKEVKPMIGILAEMAVDDALRWREITRGKTTRKRWRPDKPAALRCLTLRDAAVKQTPRRKARRKER